MKTKTQLINPILLGAFVLTLCVSFAPRAFAVEGGLGRPISGHADRSVRRCDST
jgi:hypothetical protein